MKIDRTKDMKIKEEMTAEEITGDSTQTPVSTSNMSLTDFIIKKANKEVGTTKVNIGGEFKDYDFTIRPVNLKTITTAKNKTTVYNKKREILATKDEEFLIKVIIDACVEPNFRDVNLIKSLNVPTPEEAVRVTFPKAGQMIKLANKIMDVSELDDVEDLEEQAKN